MRLPFPELSLLSGIRKKIIASFIAIFLLLLPLFISQSVTVVRQASEYRAIIENMGRASRLNMTIKTEIEPIVWDIVAGKSKLETSGLRGLISNVKSQINTIKLDYYSRNNRTMMDVVLRTTSTLESYIGKLERQIAERRPVSVNEATLEEIRGVVSLITDQMQNFMEKQMNEFSTLNERISERNRRYFIFDMFLLAVALTVSFFAIWTISGSISGPIEKLREMASRISHGNFHTGISLEPDGELSELADSMNSMAGRIELLLKKSVQEERSLKISEMKTLQAQITPHFLYNTLDAIIWAAESNRSRDVIKLVTALSSFFRITLSHGVDFIPLRDEILHVENYLIIQQMRYSDILEYNFSVDDDILDDVVLKLLLQPLVENALYHGVRKTRGRSLITVAAAKRPDGISFAVSDTGAGMTAERLEEVRGMMKGEPRPEGEKGGPPDKKAGFGLFNVNRRLELCYGKGGLAIESAPGGTTVSFLLPRSAPDSV
ncbi:MAG: sensor histidine kinase [Synergistaceae bacterium]|jgi:two-component system sensor histidine kinase YesM|nr:sensor histidine kinase [Synergistaceae bacterium]